MGFVHLHVLVHEWYDVGCCKTKQTPLAAEVHFLMRDDFKLVSNAAALTPFQRRLFNLLLWHAVSTGIDADTHTVALDEIHHRLGTAGRTRQWVLFNLEKIAATHLRWHLAPEADGVSESGFCPLLSSAWITADTLAYRLPTRLQRFAAARRLRHLLHLHIEDLFRHPFTAGIYHWLLGQADAGTTGWTPVDRFCRAADISAATLSSDVRALRDKLAVPAAEEISMFSGLAVTAAVRSVPGDDGPEIKFTVRRKDDARPDACLLLPGAGEGPITEDLALEQRFEAHKAGLVCNAAAAMDASEMADIRRRFLDSIRNNAVMMKKYEKDGFDSLAVKMAFEVYLENLLLDDRQRDLEWYRKQVERVQAEGG